MHFLAASLIALAHVATWAGPQQRPATAAEPAGCRAQFADSTLANIAWPDLTSERGVTMEVRSSACKAPLVATVSNVHASSGDATRLSRALRFEPPPTTAARSGLLRLHLHDDGAFAGIAYDGVIELRVSGDTTLLATRPFEIRTPSPLVVRDWAAVAIRPFPLVAADFSTVVPTSVALDSSALAGTCGARRWILRTPATSSPEHIAYACAAPLEGTPGIEVRVTDLRYAGNYSGKLAILSGFAADSLTLRIRVTDFFLWPLVVLALGVFIALRSENYFGVRRRWISLRVRALSVNDEWKRAIKDAPTTIGPDIGDDLERRVLDIDARIRGIWMPAFAVAGGADASFDKLTAEVATLEDAVRGWPELERGVGALNAAVSAAQGAWASHPQPANAVTLLPAIIDSATALLAHTPIAVDQMAAVAKKITDVASVLDRLRAIGERLGRFDTWLADIAKLSPRAPATDPGCTVETVKVRLAQARQDLWEATTASVLDRRGTEAALDGIGRCLAALDPRPPIAPEAVALPQDLSFDVERGVRPEPTGEGAAQPRPTPPAVTAAKVRMTLSRSDLTFGIIAWIVAALGWLTTSYLGQAFGSLPDYIKAFSWGFGTKVGIEVLMGVLTKMTVSSSVQIPGVRDPRP